MPKVKQNLSNRLQTYVNLYGPNIFSIDKSVLFCKICEIKVNSDKKFNVSIDETTDVQGRYIANVIVGTLEKNNAGNIFLLNSEELEKANHSTISKLFDRSMSILWPAGIQHDNVLLFLSDAAPYMVKSGEVLKSLYSKMIHVTCVVNGLHRVAEEVRSQFRWSS